MQKRKINQPKGNHLKIILPSAIDPCIYFFYNRMLLGEMSLSKSEK